MSMMSNIALHLCLKFRIILRVRHLEIQNGRHCYDILTEILVKIRYRMAAILNFKLAMAAILKFKMVAILKSIIIGNFFERISGNGHHKVDILTIFKHFVLNQRWLSPKI